MKEKIISVILPCIIVIAIFGGALLRDKYKENHPQTDNSNTDHYQQPTENGLYAMYALEEILNGYTEDKYPSYFGGVTVKDEKCVVLLTEITEENKQEILSQTQRDDAVIFETCRFSINYLRKIANNIEAKKISIVNKTGVSYAKNCVTVDITEHNKEEEKIILDLDIEGNGEAIVFEVIDPNEEQYDR